MKSRKKLDQYHKKFHLISPWYFFLVAVIFLAIGVYGLRQNNFTMIRLRQAVITADEKNTDVEGALENLREFVYNHMNTNLSGAEGSIYPPIQLKNRYEALVKKQSKNIDNYNKNIQDEGSKVCAKKFPKSGYNSDRVNCISDYVSRNAKTASDAVPPELYMFDFVSPRWSPDLAGFSLLISAIFFILFACRYAVELWFKSKI